LIGKIDEFRLLCNNVFDVICVNETNCDTSVFDSELFLPDFNILRRDRNRNGGGVALYIRDVFNFKRRDDLCDDNVECIWAEITPPHRSPFLVCAVYNPNGNNPDFAPKLSVMLSKASIDNNNEIIVLGDTNCDFTPNVSSKEINDLKFVTELHQLQQLINLPTRVT
jgi:exonuclease III